MSICGIYIGQYMTFNWLSDFEYLMSVNGTIIVTFLTQIYSVSGMKNILLFRKGNEKWNELKFEFICQLSMSWSGTCIYYTWVKHCGAYVNIKYHYPPICLIQKYYYLLSHNNK